MAYAGCSLQGASTFIQPSPLLYYTAKRKAPVANVKRGCFKAFVCTETAVHAQAARLRDRLIR